jgi:hypothetical protein
MPTPQTYATHVRYVPRYLTALVVLIVHAGWTFYEFFTAMSVATARAAAVAGALVFIALYARSFALRAQDRIIRLETLLRLRALLPADLQSRVPDFTIDQLVALRFASDRELPALAARVLRDSIRDRKAIKLLITEWQADDLRV